MATETTIGHDILTILMLVVMVFAYCVNNTNLLIFAAAMMIWDVVLAEGVRIRRSRGGCT